MEKPSKEILDNWHEDPNNWKFGGIYYNKEDKRIFPPKRVKWMGWTVNFANTKSVLVFALVMILVIAILYNSKATN
jgi:uncharacterized membrane protein